MLRPPLMPRRAARGFPWAATLAVAAAASAAVPATAAGARYYVSPGGSDAAAGTSPRTAWRSLDRASATGLGAGDRLLLRRGGTWSGKLAVSRGGTASSPAVVSSYGRGRRPQVVGGRCLAIKGSYVVVSGLEVRDCAWAGVEVEGDHVTITRSVVEHNVAGIYIHLGADAARVSGNRLLRNNRMSVLTPGGDDDSGAFGVLVHGDGAVVAYNTISGSDTFSYDYGRDGGAVEIYGGRGTVVHHNRAIDNETFSELGNPRTAGTTYAYNVVRSSVSRSKFLVVPGARSGYGPARGTVALHNTAFLAGAASEGIVCYSGCSADVLRIRNNIVQAQHKAAYADGQVDEGGNIFFGGRVQLQMGPGSRVANPRFRNAGAGDLRLRRGSPAIDSATGLGALSAPGRVRPRDGDRDGRAVLDVGALEFRR